MQVMKMVDEKDRKILNILVEDPGSSQKEIAEKIGMTAPAVNNRLQKLRVQKIIEGTNYNLALDKLGYDVIVLVNVKIRNGKLTEAAEKYAKSAPVCSLYTITGEYDMVIVAKFPNTKQLQYWNEKMTQDTEFIERINTSLVFNVKKEGTNPNKIE